jgi:transcriptional regulator with XRE-family HTH domain
MKQSMGSVGRPPKEGKMVKYPDFAERIQTLSAQKNMVRRDFVRPHSEISDSTFGNYWHGFRLPNIKHAKKIAEKLGITVDYLLYGKQDEAPTILEVPVKSKLNPEEIYILKRIMEKITGRPYQENFIIVCFA